MIITTCLARTRETLMQTYKLLPLFFLPPPLMSVGLPHLPPEMRILEKMLFYCGKYFAKKSRNVLQMVALLVLLALHLDEHGGRARVHFAAQVEQDHNVQQWRLHCHRLNSLVEEGHAHTHTHPDRHAHTGNKVQDGGRLKKYLQILARWYGPTRHESFW